MTYTSIGADKFGTKDSPFNVGKFCGRSFNLKISRLLAFSMTPKVQVSF
jgi:hypothetical protein